MLTALLVLEIQLLTATSTHCGLSSSIWGPKQAETSLFQSLEPDTVYWISTLALLFQGLLPILRQYFGLINTDTRAGPFVS